MATVKLLTSDQQTVEAARDVVAKFGALEAALNDCDQGDDEDAPVIPLPNVDAATLEKVLEHARFHAKDPLPDKDAIAAFDKLFISMDKDALYKVILAANFLNAADLLDLGCQAVADMIAGKTPEEIREEFGLENDFTPEEEAEIRAQNAWAFD